MEDDQSKEIKTTNFREQILRDLEKSNQKERVSAPDFPDSDTHNTSAAKEDLEGFVSNVTDANTDHEHGLQDEEQSHELEDTIIAPVTREAMQVQTRKGMNRRQRNNRHKQQQEIAARRIVTVVVVIVLAALAITVFSGYAYIKSSLDPINRTATENIQVEIPEGSTTRDIGNILVENNLIKNAMIFNYYVRLKSYNNFQSGYYNLNQSMSVDDLAKALQESGTSTPQAPVSGKVLIIEGYTIDQIANAITNNVNTSDTKDATKFTSEEFLATIQNQDFINRMVATYPTLFASLPSISSGVKYQLEGYLFPATYDYSNDTTIEELVEKMIAAMDANLQGYYDQLPSKGLTVNQLLTLASLVEKEGATDEDRRNIASVFYNRLNMGTPLQSNIALLYAMGKLGENTTLTEDAMLDTTIDSPYNIYSNTGLMPGPVASPSLSAIEATINPNTTDYYYFVADVTTGTIYYATNYEEHQQNVEQYVNSKINQ